MVRDLGRSYRDLLMKFALPNAAYFTLYLYILYGTIGAHCIRAPCRTYTSNAYLYDQLLI